MKSAMPITTLFLDIGGVLLNNGWDHIARRKVAKHFNLEWAEMEERHRLTFETHEEGKLTLHEYLGRVVLYQKRAFTRAQFRSFMCEQSKAYPEMIQLITQLKVRHRLKMVVVSNEARVVNDYRIHKFKLDEFVDSFISSCFVHIRKPDADIFRLALDIAQTPAQRVVYIENTSMFVRIAEGLGVRGILHTDYKSTCAQLASFGLANEGALNETANPCILAIDGGPSSIEFAVNPAGEPLKRTVTLQNAETAGVISTDASRATVRVIRTDEDLMIARSVCGILETGAGNGKDRP